MSGHRFLAWQWCQVWILSCKVGVTFNHKIPCSLGHFCTNGHVFPGQSYCCLQGSSLVMTGLPVAWTPNLYRECNNSVISTKIGTSCWAALLKQLNKRMNIIHLKFPVEFSLRYFLLVPPLYSFSSSTVMLMMLIYFERVLLYFKGARPTLQWLEIGLGELNAEIMRLSGKAHYEFKGRGLDGKVTASSNYFVFTKNTVRC